MSDRDALNDLLKTVKPLALSGLKTLKMCVGYKKPDGTILKDFPPALEELADCKPIYEEFEGFSEDDAKAAYSEANTAKPGLFPDTE